MNVLLLNTPFYRLMGSHYNGISLGLLYVAAVLRDGGHNVKVLNADYEDRNDYLDQIGIFKGYEQYKRIHDDPNHPIWNDAAQEVIQQNPDYIGITMFTANYKAVTIIANKIKKYNPKIKIVIGGVHPSLSPIETLQSSPDFDYLIKGEGEYAMLDLVNDKNLSQISGLCYRENNTIKLNPSTRIEDLDQIPFPARDLIINPRDNTDFGQIITGRGCQFACSYCASPSLWGRNVKFRSVNNIIEELILVTKNYPYKEIYFEDDTFTMKKDRTLELCEKIIENNLNIKWKCDTRADCIDELMVQKMKEAGCIRVKIGVESGSETILRDINKRVNKKTILKAANIIKNNGIPLTIYLMAGFPNETDEDLKQTLQFAKEIDADYYSLSILAPYYGTTLYNEFIKTNHIDKEHWEYFYHQSGAMIMNNQLSKSLIEEFLSLNDRKKK